YLEPAKLESTRAFRSAAGRSSASMHVSRQPAPGRCHARPDDQHDATGGGASYRLASAVAQGAASACWERLLCAPGDRRLRTEPGERRTTNADEHEPQAQRKHK